MERDPITKEKFAAKYWANFDLEDTTGGEDVDELDLVYLAKMSNHTFHTFNHAYAGTTTLTMSMLHRSYRASERWRTLFRFGHILQGKRLRDVSELQVLIDCKRARFRPRDGHAGADLLAVTRKLYPTPTYSSGCRASGTPCLLPLGPRPAEQVIVILATGSGKTLIVMVGAALNDTGTTIPILPTVALRRLSGA